MGRAAWFLLGVLTARLAAIAARNLRDAAELDIVAAQLRGQAEAFRAMEKARARVPR